MSNRINHRMTNRFSAVATLFAALATPLASATDARLDAALASAEDADGGKDCSASVSFLRFARALLEGDPAARLGDADVRAAEFFTPVQWEALERGGGLACYGAFKTPDTTDWILFASREEHSKRAE